MYESPSFLVRLLAVSVLGTMAACGGGDPIQPPTPTVPQARAGAPYASEEGSEVEFDGSDSADVAGGELTYLWSFGDGSSGSGMRPVYRYRDDGSYLVVLTVTNATGQSSPPDTTVATINNVPPAVGLTLDASAVVIGDSVALAGTFSVPGLDDAPWSFTIAWGDGSELAGSVASQEEAITARHAFAAAGVYTVRLSVTDKDAGTDSQEATVRVDPRPNRPPTASPGGPYSGVEGSAIRFDGSASNDPEGDPLTFAWSFGDGATGSGATPSHSYADDGSYTVTLTVTDAAGAAHAATTTVTVGNVAPTVSLALGAASVAVGEPLSLTGSFSDPGVLDAPWSYEIAWGDGARGTGTVATQSQPITATHSYATAGSHSVRLRVTDKDGGTGSATRVVTVTPPPAAVLIGAGDIAGRGRDAHGIEYQDSATAALLDRYPDAIVFTAGDNAYPDGTAQQFADCYHPTWGRHKERTRPSAGNHEYQSPGAARYFEYFGASAGEPDRGYYSYRLGSWHVIVLNSNIDMAAGSEQERWLRADLAAHPAPCRLAIWHHARFSSNRSDNRLEALWNALYDARAELVVASHDHYYDRLAPMRGDGTLDRERGIRQFVVGTGGARLYPFYSRHPHSEVRDNETYGVLKLTLEPESYRWEFIPVAGQRFTDSGTGSCR